MRTTISPSHIQIINQEQKSILRCQLSNIIFRLGICLKKQEYIDGTFEVDYDLINKVKESVGEENLQDNDIISIGSIRDLSNHHIKLYQSQQKMVKLCKTIQNNRNNNDQ